MELQGDLSTFQRNIYKHPSSKAVRLQWRWQELRDRECRAQQHNRQLLQDFERAQETLREMMARTAAMKMIRLDYERYLDEITPCWQEPAQKKMEKHLKECLKRMEERERQATQPPIELPSSKGQKNNQKGTVPKDYYSQNGHLDYNLDARIQSSWLTHTGFQSARFPDRRPSYLQGSSHGPRPSSHSPPVSPHRAQPVQPYQLSSASTYRHTVPLLGPPLWADTQTDCPFSWGAPAPRLPWTQAQPSVSEHTGWGLMQQGVEERVERYTGPKPKEELRGEERCRDSSDHRSQELDIKPVRLSSGHESSVTSTDSSQASRKSSQNRKQRERRGKAERRSTDDEGSRQHAAVIASASVDQSLESDGSLEISNGRIRRSVGQSVTLLRVEKSREKNRSKRSHSRSQTSVSTESLSQSEEPVSQISRNPSPEDQSVSNRESVSHIQESESVNTRTGDNGDTGDTVSEKRISAKQSVSADEGEKGKEEETGEEDENKESSQQEDQERENDEGEGFVRKSLPEKDGEYDEDETEGHGSEGEEEDGEQSDEESVEDYSATTQDREMEADRCVESEESREGEDDASDEGGAEEEKWRSEDVGKDSQAAEPDNERDSDSDSIISPQNHRSNRNIHTIPEEVEEIKVSDDNGKESPKDYSNKLSDEEDDIENILAPQAEMQKKEENVQKGSDKPEVVCEDVASFSEQPISKIKETQDTDSEFDHFYD